MDDFMVAAIDAYAARHEIKRSDAIRKLIDIGLVAYATPRNEAKP
jgi:metal-responsive CopG/Arc/MetJ family transcriptional regulator